MKIRDVAIMAAIGLALAAVAALCLVERESAEQLLGRRYVGTVAGCVFCAIASWAAAVWYLFSSPAQNARFIRWAEGQAWIQKQRDFDWTLLDTSNPDYDVPTIRYLLRRMRDADRKNL